MYLPQEDFMKILHCLDYESIYIASVRMGYRRFIYGLFFLTFPSRILKSFLTDIYLSVMLNHI